VSMSNSRFEFVLPVNSGLLLPFPTLIILSTYLVEIMIERFTS